MAEGSFKRSKNKYIAGVCGGTAAWFDTNPQIFRILWIMLTIITFLIPGILVYIILWLTMEPPDD